jgi:hypothetical protein
LIFFVDFAAFPLIFMRVMENSTNENRSSGLFSVRDSATDTFSAPFVALSEADAVRQMSHALSNMDGKHLYFTHPQDFDLFRMADWSPSVGVREMLIDSRVSLSPVKVVSLRVVKDSLTAGKEVSHA